jgi:hypothetical protein
VYLSHISASWYWSVLNWVILLIWVRLSWDYSCFLSVDRLAGGYLVPGDLIHMSGCWMPVSLDNDEYYWVTSFLSFIMLAYDCSQFSFRVHNAARDKFHSGCFLSLLIHHVLLLFGQSTSHDFTNIIYLAFSRTFQCKPISLISRIFENLISLIFFP